MTSTKQNTKPSTKLSTKPRSKTTTRRVSDAELVRQIARKLCIAWAIVDRETNRLLSTFPSRRDAYGQRSALEAPEKTKVIRVDLRVKGLSA